MRTRTPANPPARARRLKPCPHRTQRPLHWASLGTGRLRLQLWPGASVAGNVMSTGVECSGVHTRVPFTAAGSLHVTLHCQPRRRQRGNPAKAGVLRGGGRGSRGSTEGRQGLPAPHAGTPELRLKPTRDTLTCLPAANDASEASDTTVRQKRPSMRGQTRRRVPVLSCW